MSAKVSLAILLLTRAHLLIKSTNNMLLQEIGTTDSINTVNLGLTFTIYFI